MLNKIILILCFASFACVAEDAVNFEKTTIADNPNWMSRLEDKNIRFSQLSLPGTHDSAAYRHPGSGCNDIFAGPWCRTQSLDIVKQLNAGIRVLDLRMQCSGLGDLRMHHGVIDLHLSFKKEILPMINDHLRRNPGETIYARIRNEIGDEKHYLCDKGSFSRNLESELSEWPSLIWRSSGAVSDPTLSETQGKLVILRSNFPGATEWGLDYTDTKKFNIQDSYELIDSYWEIYNPKFYVYIANQIERANESKASGTIFFNYLSASGSGTKPWFVASGQKTDRNGGDQWAAGKVPESSYYPYLDKVNCKKSKCTLLFYGTNKLTLRYLNSKPIQFVGVVMMDFPGAELIDKIVRYNK